MFTSLFDAKPVTQVPLQTTLYRDTKQSIDARVQDLLSQMTLKEKIGQMALVEKNSIREPDDIARYHLGGLLSGAGAKPEENTPQGWKDMIDGYQERASQSRLGIPLLYGADAIHGHALVEGATVFPHAIGLGATNNPGLVKTIAYATAQDMKATGVNWNFSPNLDVPQDIRWGRVYEAFSDDPERVSVLGAAYLRGLQDGGSANNVFVLATPKHYLGLGSMVWGTSKNKNYQIDQGVTPDNAELLQSVYLPPFKEAVDAGALSIMVGLNTWGDERIIFQKDLLTTALKEDVGFKGFLVSDWYGVHEGQRHKFWATVRAINAGVDMVMLPFDYEEFVSHVTWANRLGLISDERIDDAVGRILYAKFSLGLFDEVTENKTNSASFTNHAALAQDAVAQSLVLLKNESSVLPISQTISHVRVAGSSADNVGRQMGAWSIEWQGVDGNWVPNGTSILEGIKEKAGPQTVVEYSETGDFPQGDKKAPLGIAVVGESPYAEGWGDTMHPILSDADREAIKRLQSSCDKVVVVIVSGRPLLIENEVTSFDGLVAAWLPGTEGGGVADVLFGSKPFTGTLPLPWPRRTEQLPITTEGVTSDGTPVLFPRSFGLQYE